MQQVQPQLEVQIDTGATPFAEGYFEATVSATVTAKVGEQARCSSPRRCRPASSSCATSPRHDLNPLLGIACPTILFPYLREAISDLVIRGGFPPVLLAPVSFEALYMQRMQQQQQQPPQGPEGGGPKIELAPVTRVAVLGAGAWGTAIASVLAARLDVTLWARDAGAGRRRSRARGATSAICPASRFPPR